MSTFLLPSFTFCVFEVIFYIFILIPSLFIVNVMLLQLFCLFIFIQVDSQPYYTFVFPSGCFPFLFFYLLYPFLSYLEKPI